MSIESYTSTKKAKYDAQFDYEFKASEGSSNPYVEGTPMDVEPREAIVHLLPLPGKSTTPNVVHISPDAPVHAVYYRVYSPSNGVTITASDLPKIFAYDFKTGEETACPEAELGVIFAPNLPQSVLAWVPARFNLNFKRADQTIFAKLTSSGNNSAVPSYLYSLTRMRSNQVALIKFKAPTFFDTRSGEGLFSTTDVDVRYWSFCTQNLAKGDTLRCLPDFLAKPSSDGVVKLVIGRGSDLRSAAERRGYDFIEDIRGSDQPVLQMIYRNLLPSPGFERDLMYEGDYQPSGIVCSKREFLTDHCSL